MIINAQSAVQGEHESGEGSGWHVSEHDVGSSPVIPYVPYVQYSACRIRNAQWMLLSSNHFINQGHSTNSVVSFDLFYYESN